MKKIKTFLCLLLSATLAFTPLAAYPAFDPVNDDTDIFLANPNINALRPNVLVILDNTANWNQPFTNEKAALVTVINSLSSNFNVGLMMMAETGGSNDNVDGGYVRFHVRQMTSGFDAQGNSDGSPNVKGALSSLVGNLDILADKGNNNTVGLALYEAYLYYAGKASNASHGKIKTDFDNTTDSKLNVAALNAAGLRALPSSGTPPRPVSTDLYRSPATDGCQKNYIIYISNGAVNENASARAFVQAKLTDLKGGTAPSVIDLSPEPTGQQANWGDEMAEFMANADVNANLTGTQNVFSYVVEVNPQTTGQGPDTTALMKSVGTKGKGGYFSVTDDASGVGIADVLTSIFDEIQAVNSVFAATTLPVSINTRGTNVNQVYIGVFRPDAHKAPRWLGNLKMYQLALDGADVILADVNGDPAANPGSNRLRTDSTSIWTQSSNFWAYKDTDPKNPFGVGGASDSPDGDLVEKGGAAQQIRLAYPNAENPTGSETLRKVYTCTTGGFAQCNPGSSGNAGSSLSATPFNDANTDIDAISLALDTLLISPLTALDTKTVTGLTDRRAATLDNSNPAGAIAVNSLSNGATTRAITTLTTALPKTVSSLTGIAAQTQQVTLSTVAKVSGNTYRATATTSPLANGFAVNGTVTIAGVSGNTNFNGTRTISAVSGATFDFSCGGCGNTNGTGGTATATGTTPSTLATATLAGHGYSDGQPVTIANASPTQFNGTWNITVVDADHFTYIMNSAGGAATGSITAAGNTTTATATSVGHGFLNNTSVTISGASDAAYNGTKVITVIDANTFTYSVAPSRPSANIASPVYAVQGGSTTVTATTAAAHGFTNGQTVNITGSDIGGYNGTFSIGCTPSPACTGATTFTYTTTSILPANNSGTVKASGSTLAEVTVTAPNHGLSVTDSVVVEKVGGGTDGLTSTDASPWAVTFADTNTFKYSTPTAQLAPSGSYTVRRPSASNVAIVTVTGHGYAASQQVQISGATPTAYNGTYSVSKVIDANTFEYVLGSAPGTNTSSAVTSSIKTMTARATSVAHGLATNDTVTISGATPADFNVTNAVITKIDDNTFSYPIATVQGDATGTIIASSTGATSTARTSLIKWVRGEDNFEDENLNTSKTDIRASVHGDVLHSRPSVVNYNRFGSDNDVYVFYGANDGMLHAIKGGFAKDAADTAGPQPGQEAWTFIAKEFFGDLKRLRNNSPVIGSSFKKPYFADGPITVFTKDTNNDGKIVAADGDRAILYITMHRGGRFVYALDVSNPLDPKFMWKIDTSTAGFAELGQSWSAPALVDEGVKGYPHAVLVFGAGYDPAVEDIEPNLITAFTSTGVTTGAGTTNRTMGRGIFVVDALTGALVWRALGGNSTADSTTAFTTTVSGMDYAIPADVAVIKNETGGAINRAYVGDTGGNMWRVDFRSSDPTDPTVENLDGTLVTKLASIGSPSSLPGGLRKFMHSPDVVAETGFDAVLVGTGDREHPFDTGVVNRFYMFKDLGDDTGPVTGTDPTNAPTIIESAMFDATSNCIQDCTGQTQTDAQTALGSSKGWFITLGSGEKTVGPAVSIAGETIFNTNQPDAGAGGATCEANLGIARQYQVNTIDATAVRDLNLVGGLTGADRSAVIAGGGYLPPPSHVIVVIDGKPVEAVLSGPLVTTPTGATLSARLRKYWFKEVDQP